MTGGCGLLGGLATSGCGLLGRLVTDGHGLLGGLPTGGCGLLGSLLGNLLHWSLSRRGRGERGRGKGDVRQRGRRWGKGYEDTLQSILLHSSGARSHHVHVDVTWTNQLTCLSDRAFWLGLIKCHPLPLTCGEEHGNTTPLPCVGRSMVIPLPSP